MIAVLALVSAVTAFPVSYAGGSAPATIKWKNAPIRIAVSSSLTKENPNVKSGNDAAEAVERSLSTWKAAAGVDFEIVQSEKANASPSGPEGDGVSLITIAATPENLLMFAKEPDLVAAATRVFFNNRGQITEADIVLNPYQQFSTDGTFGTFDLESTITHEIGHLLGLEHSPLLASTMHENYGKNGVYGLQNFSTRTLAADDVAAIRSLYGPPVGELKCCGGVSGRLLLEGGKPAKNADIWLEEISTGRIAARGATAADGSFRITGVPEAKYRVLAESAAFGAQSIGEIEIGGGEASLEAKRIVPGSPAMSLSYMGFNGQLAGLPVVLNAGRTYTVYVGGTNIDAKSVEAGTGSPYLTIDPDSISQHDYGDQISVISFQVRIHQTAPAGEYSVFLTSARGGSAYIKGALTVESHLNPFSTFTYSAE